MTISTIRHTITCTILLVLPGMLALAGEHDARHSGKSTALPITSVLECVLFGNNAAYYYALKDFRKADSFTAMRIMSAEATGNNVLILEAHFSNPRFRGIGSFTGGEYPRTTEEATKIKEYIDASIAYATASRQNDYVALGHANLSMLYALLSRTSDALREANLAYSNALAADNDSIRVVCTLQLGNAYLKQRDIVLAFKTYTQAYDLAVELDSRKLLSACYRSMALLYNRLNNPGEAKKYATKSLALSTMTKDSAELIEDYIALGALYDEHYITQRYFDKAEAIALTHNDISQMLRIQHLTLYLKIPTDMGAALQYLESHKLLKKALTNSGPAYLDWKFATIYYYGKDYKSALPFFKVAEPLVTSAYTLFSRKQFFGELGDCYMDMDSVSGAIRAYEQALAFCREAGDIGGVREYASQLQNLYHRTHRYELAYNYSIESQRYKDSANRLEKSKEMALLEIENINKDKLRITEQEQIALERKHNLQYMGITAAIASLFFVLVMLGLFSLSTVMVRGLGFFAFIFFFEFLTLIADTKIHHAVDGDPLKIWLIKIALLSMLLPLHHYLEEKLIHYLIHHKKLRPTIPLGKLVGRLGHPFRKRLSVPKEKAAPAATPD